MTTARRRRARRPKWEVVAVTYDGLATVRDEEDNSKYVQITTWAELDTALVMERLA